MSKLSSCHPELVSGSKMHPSRILKQVQDGRVGVQNDSLKVLTAILIFLLTGCGFKPIYGENHQSLPVKVASIHTVSQEYGKLEYIMRHELESAFNPTHTQQPAQYIMRVRLLKSTLSFATQSTRVSTRQRIDLRADFVLTDLSGKVIADDYVIASDSSDITVSPYSSLISEEESSNLLAKTLAQEIGLRVAATLETR